ncbi:MAG: hypothetical protein QOE70_667 [Chthoniobacter sp.]|jgi:hypothetical protein|nr:hypothetical protein [Chthoniobacter sp.]
MAKSLRYSSTSPFHPGYYWQKTADDEEIVEVWIDPAETEHHLWIHRCGDGESCEVSKVENAQWAGPIPKPNC